MLKTVMFLVMDAMQCVAVRQNETNLVVEAANSTHWLPVCASHISDEFASELCRELGQGQVIDNMLLLHMCSLL